MDRTAALSRVALCALLIAIIPGAVAQPTSVATCAVNNGTTVSPAGVGVRSSASSQFLAFDVFNSDPNWPLTITAIRLGASVNGTVQVYTRVRSGG